MSRTYIIAECATCWRHGPNELKNALRMIKLCKEAGADAFKTQWTSDHVAMEARRGAAPGAYQRLSWPAPHHAVFKALCDEAGIDYLCTVFLPKDVHHVAPYVAAGKVSAFESEDKALLREWRTTRLPFIISANAGKYGPDDAAHVLHCVSNYPTKLEDLHLIERIRMGCDGLSDHSTSVLTGAVAVGAGARVLEKHVMTHDTPHDDPDYGHSLILDTENKEFSFRQYVQNVRDAEKMMYG